MRVKVVDQMMIEIFAEKVCCTQMGQQLTEKAIATAHGRHLVNM